MMPQSQSLFSLTRELWRHLSRRRRNQFFLILGLMLLASLAEVVSVGAVLPFLGVLTAPDMVFAQPVVQQTARWIGVHNAQQLLLPLTGVFIVAVVVAGAIRLALLYVTTRFSYAVGADFSIEVYRRTLYQPYAVHISRNSSEIINGIVGKTAMLIGSVLVPLLTLFSSSVLLLGILLALLAVDPVTALTAALGFMLIYWSILRLSRRRLQQNSECIARESTQVIKSLQEGLGGIRDVLIDGNQAAYCHIYQNADRPLRLAQGNNSFISASPRYAIETLGMVLIAGLAYVMSQRPDGVATAVPVLGALALGAQRLLPILQQGYSSFAIIRGAEASLRDSLALLDQPLPAYAALPAPAALAFKDSIKLHNLGFRYGEQLPWVLSGVELSIARGMRVGIMGATGSGKSTALDLFMGLLAPSEGEILIDGVAVTEKNARAWQAHIAHVPQSIYLADSSIEENIAFGVPKANIDFARVQQAARQAQIAEMIEGLPEKYRTSVGERGVKLSGGQRQRIGIARALYKQADVLVFDEATSALDNATEHSVMDAINELGSDLTIIIVAHRLSTLKGCDLVVEFAKGGIARTGSYHEVVSAA